ncbi:hypothetical protein BOX15_Mlig007733g2 [Macrostomum lignano]|uniref:Fibronectin type-III domain-containing protein n=2 Tax=Macrostomum lignano TaxID=282301 RepID=A0A267GPI8_9PLAT|nr:hypothetical protein BOX15_Mlig007733g2 [Macrostomum lignano]
MSDTVVASSGAELDREVAECSEAAESELAPELETTEDEVGSLDEQSGATLAGSGDSTGPGVGGGGGSEHIVMVHVGAGETFCVRVGDQVQHVRGPATVRMMSTNGPPMPMQMQVPPGHLVQQIVDENGILTHVILAPQMGTGPYYFPGVLPSNLMPSPMALTPISGYQADGPTAEAGSASFSDGQQPNSTSATATTAGAGSSSEDWYPAYQHCKRQPQPGVGGRLQRMRRSPDRHHQQQYFAPRRKRFAASQSDWGGNGVRHQQQQHYYQNSFDHGNHQSKQHLFRNRHNWNHCNNNTNVSDNFNSNGYQHYSGYQSGFRRRHHFSERGGARTNEHYLNDAGGIEQDVRFNNKLPTLETPQPPQISEIESTSVVIQVWPPSGLTDDDLLEAAYELHLSEKSARGPYSRVFDGQAEEICLRDLQPGQRYWAKSLAKLTDSISGFSLAAQFRTSPAQPAAPALPPELIGRPGANWLALRWAPAARDNGASVTAYVLECAASDRPGAEYQEVYRGPLLHHRCDGLSPGTAYWFRVAAVNALGQGDYSPTVVIATSDPAAAANNARAAPERPRPPKRLRLRNSAGAGRYVLVWSAPEDDGGCPIEEYLLEAGPTLSYSVPAEQREFDAANWLPAGRPHSVSVRASSSAGLSEPSESLSVTIPAPPGPPGPPRLRGPPRNGEMRLAWSEPGNDGGAPVTGYEARARLEDDASSSLSSPEATATTTVSSSTLHCSIAKLIPGANYIVTVRAANAAGFGPWSNRLRAVCGPPLPPAPSAPSVSVSLGSSTGSHEPLRDAQVNDDAAELTMLDGELVDADLPRVSALVSWEAPKLTPAAASSSSTLSSSGAVTDYRLECRVETGDGEAEEQEFRLLYSGELLSYKVKDLQAATAYSFRVQANNISGAGEFSPATIVTTPAAPPGPVESLRQTSAQTSSVTVAWQPSSASNGAPITGYEIFLAESDKTVSTAERTERVGADQNELTLHQLQPDCRYNIRVRAVNSAGCGSFSRPCLRASTLCLPPPRIECLPCGGGSTAVRLRWAPAASVSGYGEPPISYQVEMSSAAGEDSATVWQQVYQGTGHCARVGRLAELTAYEFRIRALNPAGPGPYGPTAQPARFTTGRSPPPPPQPPRVFDVTTTACRVEWSAPNNWSSTNWTANGESPLQFVLHMLQIGDCGNSEYRQVYKGPETSCHLGCLRPNAEYRLRVAAIRQCPDTQEELVSSFSNTAVFQARPNSSVGGSGSSSYSSCSRRSGGNVSMAPLSEAAMCSANRVAWSRGGLPPPFWQPLHC